MINFAVVQMKPSLLDAEANLKRIGALIHEAAKHGADIAVFPECAITGYALSAEEAAAIAEPISGSRTQFLSTACKSAGLSFAVIGTIEQDEQMRLFNTAVLIGPDGLIASYRKTHLPFLGVDRFLVAGDILSGPIDTSIGKLGILICYDLRFPEPTRVLALAGAQVILLPTAWPSAATLYPDFVAQTRAAENGVYIIAANRIGEERGTRYLGRSVIVDPSGEILAEADEESEEILYVEIDPRRSDQKELIFVPGEYELRLFEDRRPELYGRIGD